MALLNAPDLGWVEAARDILHATVLPLSCSMGCPSRKAAAVMSMLRVRPDWQPAGRRLWLYSDTQSTPAQYHNKV